MSAKGITIALSGKGGVGKTFISSMLVKRLVREAGGVPFIFNTIGVDDGIAMGHIGMKSSLPSREQIFGRLLGTINAPGTQAAGVVASGIRQVLYALKSRVEQLEKQGTAPV